MKSAAEEIIKQFNSSYFLREFTFPSKKIKEKRKGESELSDGIICLGDEMILFQVKERGKLNKEPTEESQRRWFYDEVKKTGTKQIRESLGLFRSCGNVDFENLRGQSLTLDFDSIKNIHKVVIYHPSYSMPRECLTEKRHISRSTGEELFIHVINAIDWVYLCGFLFAPVEVLAYLDFRERCLRNLLYAHKESEKWILGRFLASPIVPSMEFDVEPQDFEKWVDDLEPEETTLKRFDFILKNLYDKIDTRKLSPKNYCKLLLELARLDRVERKTFIERFDLTLKQACEGHNKPNRVVFHRDSGNVAFVFCPFQKENTDIEQEEWLNRLILLCKYDLKVDKCFGVCITAETEKSFWIEWGLLSGAWEYDKRMEEIVDKARKRGVLTKMKKPEVIKRYRFRNHT